MKKILTSTGLVALSAASLQAAYAPGMGPMDTSKPWSISAALRGFYDDNYATAPNNPPPGTPGPRDSWGFELNPSASVNLPMDQTFFSASASYSMKYYDDRPTHKADHSVILSAKLDHAFSERFKMELSDQFIIAQEPQLINPTGIIAGPPLRTEGNNIHNIGMASLDAQLTRELAVEFIYSNNYYDYDQSGLGSHSALLDRMEHLASINLRWTLQPQTVGIVGYQFGAVDYSSNDGLFFDPTSPFAPTAGPNFGIVPSNIRDNYSHYFYAGVDHNFNQQLNGSVRVGAQYTDYHEQNSNTLSPYVDANVTYTYNPGSYVQAGFRHQRVQTDVAGAAGAGLTLDAEASSIYASLNHKITGNLTGSILGQYQHSTFRGGAADSLSDDFFIVGLNVTYKINPWISTEAGYNFDRLKSDLGGRTYDRNRIYVGVRATY
jgi:hypothetical protein